MKKILVLFLLVVCLFNCKEITAQENESVNVNWYTTISPNVIDLNGTGGTTTIKVFHDINNSFDDLIIYVLAPLSTKEATDDQPAYHEDILISFDPKINKIETDEAPYEGSYQGYDGKTNYYKRYFEHYPCKETGNNEYSEITIDTDYLRLALKKNAFGAESSALVSLVSVMSFTHNEKMYGFYRDKYIGNTTLDENNNEYLKIIVSESDVDINPKNNDLAWEHTNGKSYWYEKVNGKFVKQGTYSDTNGVMGDGTIRGREIFDPDSNAWYWLDSVYDGAKAVAKEVWMPYIYQNEDTFTDEQLNQVIEDSNTYTETSTTANMGEQVKKAIQNKTGKWVRYDENGKMYKGWVTLEGWQEKPEQNGNIYYYDYMTGLMAKGETIIDGTTYYFDPVTGVLVR